MIRKFIAIWGLALLVAVLLAGCGKVQVKADISAYAETPITVAGLTDKEFTITASELAALPCVRQKVTAVSDKVGTVDAVGPLLATLLEAYGKSQSDFRLIRIEAADGYKTVLKGDLLSKDIILSVAEGTRPLDEKYWPLRVVIPEAPSAYWTYQVTRIECVSE